jgi:hypothetical protein
MTQSPLHSPKTPLATTVTHQHWTNLKKLVRDKRSSLFCGRVNDDEKSLVCDFDIRIAGTEATPSEASFGDGKESPGADFINILRP